ncbi:hypothetical protein HMN09_00463800 [Mycena chlorophos]|uniref:F-box domain-containing protein n=1 Tax=Mycena chlorophos TaxID=658473 RepID=A0A8H6THF8_MYCCL|nr:hypothetical protein HMN09_00463800 [Mycena chlorophos]
MEVFNLPLPIELFEAILDSLEPGDMQTLRSLSVTSRFLVSLCQRRLFASLTLPPAVGSDSDSERQHTPDVLHDLLIAAPHIAAAVRSLTLVMSPWIMKPEAAAATPLRDSLAKLTRLNCIAIEASRDPRDRTEWTPSVLLVLKNALEAAFSGGTVDALRLHRLKFGCANEMCELLRAWQNNLMKLDLSEVVLFDGQPPSANTPSSCSSESKVIPFKLHTLRLARPRANILRALAPYTMISSSLRRLELAFHDSLGYEAIMGLFSANIMALRATLEELHLDAIMEFPSIIQPSPADAVWPSEPFALTALHTLVITLRLPSKYIQAIVHPLHLEYQALVLALINPAAPVLATPNLRAIELNIQLPTQNEADIGFLGRLHDLDSYWLVSPAGSPSFTVRQWELVVRIHSPPGLCLQEGFFRGPLRAYTRRRVESIVRRTFAGLDGDGRLRVELL